MTATLPEQDEFGPKINKKRLEFMLYKAGRTLPKEVRKRDGSTASFDITRIDTAIRRCFGSLREKPHTDAADIAGRVAYAIAGRWTYTDVPEVEDIQDLVELALQSAGEFIAAKHYILYRKEHAEQRALRPVPDEVSAAFAEAASYFPTVSQQFMFFDKYSRYNYDLGRRETWVETADRSILFLKELVEEHAPHAVNDVPWNRLRRFLLEMKATPSMRLLATAGDYARDQNIAVYNCSYIPVKDTEAFCEALLISMSGCGVGYSVEREYVEQFPKIKRQKKNQAVETHWVEDSTEGWIEAVRLGLGKWFAGEDINYDFTLIRPAGTPLRKKGGRASGPEPLRQMLAFLRETIFSRQGGVLRTIDAHDMMCAVGEAAVQGGVRRTAMIALFDWDDLEMRNCKNGPWGSWPAIRSNANNSAVWPEDITQQQLLEQLLEMDRGQRGEPGIFSRANAIRTRPKRRKQAKFGTNPCGEINLRPYQFCNLSIAIARADDTVDSLQDKVEVATIFGVIQSLATKFPGLRDEWRQNCEEERLLGVDILGQMDCIAVRDEGAQAVLKKKAVATAEKYANFFGIPVPAAVTCVKPGGNSSQLFDAASGLKDRHSEYLVRNMRVSASSPVFKVLRDAAVPMDPENGQTAETATTWVIHFPMKSPEGAVMNRSAIEQLEYWKSMKTCYTEHNPSCTINYSPDELIDVVKWLWDNREIVGGLSFLPRMDAQYNQMPYEMISKEEYEERLAAFPPVDFSKIYKYEQRDMTTAAQELACFSGQCES